MVARRDMPLSDALAVMRARRPQTSPNDGFMRQLIEFERRTRGTTSLEPPREHAMWLLPPYNPAVVLARAPAAAAPHDDDDAPPPPPLGSDADA